MKKLRLGLVVFFTIICSTTCVFAEVDSDEPTLSDPIEPINRGIFWFNDKFDVYLLEPVARGYDKVLPQKAQKSVRNFFRNLTFPARLVGDLISLQLAKAASDLGRFAINTTAGIGGLFDVATEAGISNHEQDIGLALGTDGIPPGPYLVLPFLGPSNLRDGVGTLADFALDPIYYLGATGMNEGTASGVSSGLTAFRAVSKRAKLLDAVKTAKAGSVDYYLFMQGAYTQYRDGLVKESRGEPAGADEAEGNSALFNADR